MPDPLDPWLGGGKVAHHEHVEPHRKTRQLRSLLQQLLRRARDAPLLAAVDALGCGAKPRVRASAHLGNDEHAALACDEVELAESP